ncbi:MAG: hypothetical protein VZS44_00625 [Bacilli bacterium]|nr:hypothetical protein [Bacilli bacterium]
MENNRINDNNNKKDNDGMSKKLTNDQKLENLSKLIQKVNKKLLKKHLI